MQIKLQKAITWIVSQRRISIWTMPFLLAVSIASVAAYLKTVHTDMTEFYGRAIGDASIHGVDAPVRVTTFWICIFLFASTFLLSAFLVEKVQTYCAKRFLASTFELERTMLFELSILLLLNELIFLYQFVVDSHAVMSPYVIIAFTVVCLHTLMKAWEVYTKKKLPEKEAFTYALAFLYPVPFTYVTVFAVSIHNDTVQVASIGTVVIYFVFYFLIRIFFIQAMHPYAAAYALVPLSFVPMMYIVGNEWQYTLTKQGIVLGPKIITAGCIVVLIAAAIIYYWKKKQAVANRIQRNTLDIVLPVLLVTLSMFATHLQVIEGNFDLLHNGNLILPVQQFFQFGKLPFLDIWPHQHLPLLSYLYVLLNGLNYLELNIWTNMSDAIVYTLICYFVLRQFFNQRLTAFLMLFTPIVAYANTYYMSGLLPLVYLKTMRKKRRFKDYAIFFGLALTAFVYQSSSGKIAVLAAIVLIALSCSNRQQVCTAIKAVLATAAVPTIIYFSYVLFQGENLWDRLSLISALGDSDILIGSYETLTGDRTPFEILMYYGLFPLSAVLSIIFALRKKKKTEEDYGLIYVAVACIVCSLRALARHCLYEGYQTDFYPLLLVLIPYVLLKQTHVRKITAFAVMAFLILTPYVETDYGIAATGVKDFTFQRFERGEQRCDTLNNPSYPKNLRKVLDTVLTKDQTFFETINAYLLYALMERENTFLDVSTMLIQYERPQIAYLHTLEKLYGQNKVPIIITGHSDWGGCRIDHIPSELSLFKLEEWIYAHYDPWIWVDGFHLWKAKNSDIMLADDDEQLAAIPVSETNVLERNQVSLETKDSALTLHCGNEDPFLSTALMQPFDFSGYEDAELKLEYQSSSAGILQVFYGFTDYQETESANAEVFETDGAQTVYLPVVKTGDEELLKSIRFDPPAGASFEIQSVQIVRRKIRYQVKADIQQDFSMAKLPYVWGNYDEKVQKDFPKEQQRLAENLSLEPQTGIVLAIEQAIDKSSGNYLYFRIKASEAGTITLRYGTKAQNSCDFEVVPGEWDYLVRISTQYRWVNEQQEALEVTATLPVDIRQASILKGD